MKSKMESPKSGWVLLSQIIFVPIYAIFFALSKVLDVILFICGKALDYVGLFFKKVFGLLKSCFVRGEKKEQAQAKFFSSQAQHPSVQEKSPMARKIGTGFLQALKYLMVVAFSPILVVLFVCFLIYLVFWAIKFCFCKLFSKMGLRQGKVALKKKQEEQVEDSEEPHWKRKMKYSLYSVKVAVSKYFEENIFIFRASNRGNIGARRKRELRFIVLMLAFPVAQFLVFWLYVNYNSILMAFRVEQDGMYVYTLHNFKRFFLELDAAGGTMWQQIKNSLLFFTVSVFITLPLSFVFSYFLYKKVPGSGIFRVLFYLPSIMSAVSLTMLFRYTISPVGPLSILEKALGIEPIDFLGSPKYAMGTILFYTVWSGLGYNIVLLSSQMGRIPKEIFESAEIDGVGIITEILNIVLPLSYGTISTLITLSIAHLFTTIGPVILLTNGANNTNTIASFIYYKVKNSSENNMAYASAVGLVFTFVGLPIVLLGRKILSVIGENIEF